MYLLDTEWAKVGIQYMVYDYCNTVYLTFVPLCVIKRFLDTFYGSTALVSQDILVVEVQRSHSDTSHSVRLLWTRDRPVADL